LSTIHKADHTDRAPRGGLSTSKNVFRTMLHPRKVWLLRPDLEQVCSHLSPPISQSPTPKPSSPQRLFAFLGAPLPPAPKLREDRALVGPPSNSDAPKSSVCDRDNGRHPDFWQDGCGHRREPRHRTRGVWVRVAHRRHSLIGGRQLKHTWYRN
jgi:hypothetical protein